MATSSKKRFGLRLTLPGAPRTPHVVAGIPGHYRPDIPTPVGGKGEVDLGLARKVAASTAPVELIEISDGELVECEELAGRTEKEARAGCVATRRSNPKGAEVEQIKDEQKALKKEA